MAAVAVIRALALVVVTLAILSRRGLRVNVRVVELRYGAAEFAVIGAGRLGAGIRIALDLMAVGLVVPVLGLRMVVSA